MSAKVFAKSTGKSGKLASKITYASLRSWNKYLSVLHAVQGVVILILSASRAFPVTTSYLGVDSLQTQAQGHVVLASGTQQLFDVNLAFLVAAFFFMSAIAHGLMATKLRSMYEADLKKGLNKIRWIEYALSASTMMVAIGLLVGVQDISALLMLFGLTAIMNVMGLVMEVHNQGAKKVSWLSFIAGAKAGTIPWIVIAIYLIGSGVYGGAVPSFVYWIFGSMFVLFASFAVNMYLQYRKVGNWTNYVYGERVFMILSLVAKTALAWQIFAGSLHP
jgi:Heliorhodopsin